MKCSKASQLFSDKANLLDKLDGSTNLNVIFITEYRVVADLLSMFGDTELPQAIIDRYPSFLIEAVIIDNYSNVSAKFQRMTYETIEDDHTWVQWVFPISEPSRFNPNAPILTREECAILSASTVAQNLILKNLEIFQMFLLVSGVFNRFTDHNNSRISRVIKSLRLFGLHKQAEEFYRFCIKNRNVEKLFGVNANKSPEEFWEEALTIELPFDNEDYLL